MLAVLHVLQRALPPLVVHTDYKAVVTGVLKGKQWCTAPSRPHADVWKRLWHYIDDIGLSPDGITFKHVKAHRSLQAIAA